MLKEFSVYRNGSSLPVNNKSEPQLTRTPLVRPLQLIVGVARSFPNKRDFTLTAIGYLDDILVYSDSVEEHHTHVQDILQWLRKASLFANPKKCTFHTNTIDYLGFILSPKGLTMDPTKVSVIQAWPTPRNIRDIQSFLGFTNFY